MLVKTWSTENPTSHAPMGKSIPWREYVDAGSNITVITWYHIWTFHTILTHFPSPNYFIVLNVRLETCAAFILALTNTCFSFYHCMTFLSLWVVLCLIIVVWTSASVWRLWLNLEIERKVLYAMIVWLGLWSQDILSTKLGIRNFVVTRVHHVVHICGFVYVGANFEEFTSTSHLL